MSQDLRILRGKKEHGGISPKRYGTFYKLFLHLLFVYVSAATTTAFYVFSECFAIILGLILFVGDP